MRHRRSTAGWLGLTVVLLLFAAPPSVSAEPLPLEAVLGAWQWTSSTSGKEQVQRPGDGFFLQLEFETARKAVISYGGLGVSTVYELSEDAHGRPTLRMDSLPGDPDCEVLCPPRTFRVSTHDGGLHLAEPEADGWVHHFTPIASSEMVPVLPHSMGEWKSRWPAGDR